MPPFDLGHDRERLGLSKRQPCDHCQFTQQAFCAGLPPADVARLTSILGQTKFEPHDIVFSEGDQALHLFSIASGTVKLYKLLADGRRQVTAFLYPGDFFGVAVEGLYPYTAEALTPVDLCRFPRRKLEALMDEMPRLEKRLLGLAIDELASAHEQMLLLGRKTATEKVASFLLMLARRLERRGLPVAPMALPMGRGDIADYLGLTIETVSRSFTKLRRDQVIALPDQASVTILDNDALQRIADSGC